MSQKKILIASSIVGAEIKPYQFTVSARQISNYAAAISDTNDIYYNSKKKDDFYAHPLFPVRISWEIIRNLPDYLGVETPFTLKSQLVHHSEYLRYNRLPKPGDVLSLRGEIAAILPHQRGAKVILKFDYLDQQGQLICTEYIGAIIFGFKCTDSGRGRESIPQIDRIAESEAIWTENIAISRVSPYIYDGCTDIIYPVHTDRIFARSMGLPDIILQGSATLAMSVSKIIEKELGEDPKSIAVVAGKFTDIVIPPNSLSVQLLKRSGDELYFDVREESGKYVIRGGYIKTKKKQ